MLLFLFFPFLCPVSSIVSLLSPTLLSYFPHSFIYNGFKGLKSTNITLNGVAEITGDGVLKLTNVTSRSIDRGFYPDPIRFRNPITKQPISFSTSFVFSVTLEYRKLGGHGLAFTISPNKDLVEAQPNQYLGLVNVTKNPNWLCLMKGFCFKIQIEAFFQEP